MDDDNIRIGDRVRVTDDEGTIGGHVESGHDDEWFVRTDEGELTGGWRAEEMDEDFTCPNCDAPVSARNRACSARCE